MTTPTIISAARELLGRYDVVFCDVWGVVHNGRVAYEAGCAALARFRGAGGTVILVSNAPRTARVVAGVLAEKGVRRDCWDAIVPSGDLALAHARSRGHTRLHHIGPDRDLDLFEDSGLERVAIEHCEAVVCTGLVHDRSETGEDYRPRLVPALERGLHMICANPDLVVDVGGDMLPCAGAIATVYEAMGGEVYWAGKPHAPAYEAALTLAGELRGEAVTKSRVLAIGDAVRTDIAGAAAFGVDALFIGQGIHREEVMPAGRIDPVALADLFDGGAPRALAAMGGLAW